MINSSSRCSAKRRTKKALEAMVLETTFFQLGISNSSSSVLSLCQEEMLTKKRTERIALTASALVALPQTHSMRDLPAAMACRF